MYRLIDHKQNILRPKGDQSFHTVCVFSGPSFEGDQVTASRANPPVRLDRNYRCNVSDQI